MRLFPVISALFAALLIISNTVSDKIFTVFGFSFPGGVVIFPSQRF